MEKQHSKGVWRCGLLFREITTSRPGILESSKCICRISDFAKPEYEVSANAKLIAAAPEMLEALIETDKDLCVLESTMRQIELKDHLAVGMTELIQKWRERNKQAIKKATE